MRTRTLVSLGLLVAAACDGEAPTDTPDGGGADADPATLVTDPFHGLPTGTTQWAALCARDHDDQISNAFCDGREAPPVLTSLADLYQLLGVNLDYNTPTNSNVRVTFNAHSTALPQRHTSPLNPRLFVFTVPDAGGAPNPRFLVIAFARGEPLVELVANDPSANNALRFFVLRFHPGCEQDAAGCNHADLYTPTIESGWTGYSIYDDEDVKNTTVDCRQCHQPNGPGTRKILRMQEVGEPWLHWFYEEVIENRTMIDQIYLVARPNERYGGVPSSWVRPSRPIVLERLLQNNGFGNQPNKFDSRAILTEMQNGSSPTWNAIYAEAVAGREIMVPYWGVPQTDPVKIGDAVAAYREVMAGTRPRDQLPDLADVFLDSALPAMSHRPATGLDGRGILRHMCGHCHNSRLDQTISRAGFNVEQLDQLAPSVKAEAVRRIRLPEADIRHMPPRRFHTLSAAEQDLVIAVLEE